MSREKIRITNPVRPGHDLTSPARARRFVSQGRAVWVDERSIRFKEADGRHENAATLATYDAWGREFLRSGGHLDWRGSRARNVSVIRGGFKPGEVRS